MSNTITMRLGTDLAPLKKGYEEGKQLAKATSKQVADDAKKAADAAKAATAVQIKSEEEAAKRRKETASRATDAASKVAGAFSGGNSAGEMAAAGFEAIGSLLGPVAGVATGAAFIATSMSVAAEEASAMRVQFNELNRDASFKTSANSTVGDLLDTVGNIGETIRQAKLAKEEALKRMGVFGLQSQNTVSNTVIGTFGEHVRDALTSGPSYKEEQNKREAQSLREMARLTGEAATVAAQDLDVARERVYVGERAGALAENELRTRREIAAVEKAGAMAGADPATTAAVTAQIAADGEFRSQQIRRQADASERAIASEGQLQTIRAVGNNAAVHSAEERLALAETELKAARGKQEVDRAQVAVSAAKVELTAAQEARAILISNAQAQTDIANFVGTEDQRHTFELQRQLEALKEQRKISTKPDDQKAIDVAITQAKAAQRENEKSLKIKEREREFAIATANIEARQGRGQAAEMATAAAKMAAAQKHLADLQSGPETDDKAAQIAQAKAQINQMGNAIRDQADALRMSNAAAHDETEILGAQIAGKSMLARQLQIESEYRQKVTQAQKDGNAEAVRELGIQRQQKLEALQIEQQQQTPNEKRQQRDAARHAHHAKNVVDAHNRDLAARRFKGGHDRVRLGDHLGLNAPPALAPPPNVGGHGKMADDLTTALIDALNQSDAGKALIAVANKPARFSK